VRTEGALVFRCSTLRRVVGDRKNRGCAREFRRSLKTKNRAAAERRLREWLGELEAIAWGDKPRRSWEEAAAKFIAEHFPTIKLGARRRYAVSIRHLNDHFAGKMLHQITSAEMSEFETRRRATSVSTSTIRRDLACLSSLMTSAMDSERCRAVAGEMLFEGNPIEDAADEFGQRRLAVLDGLPAKVLAIELDA
jgi:hypothetical protein